MSHLTKLPDLLSHLPKLPKLPQLPPDMSKVEILNVLYLANQHPILMSLNDPPKHSILQCMNNTWPYGNACSRTPGVQAMLLPKH
jgi:hypothetical protein